MDCIFCAIVAGKSLAHVVAEDERTIAFMDIAPLVRGHVLVVPRAHARKLWEMSPRTARHSCTRHGESPAPCAGHSPRMA